MKVFIGALGTETNTFSPLPTGWDGFKETLFCRGDATKVSDNFFAVPLHAWRKFAEADGHSVIEGLAAFAQPAGPTIQHVWEALRDQMLADITAAGPVDAVLLHMHGAILLDPMS
jgi:microcystin degradation protein MlrC